MKRSSRSIKVPRIVALLCLVTVAAVFLPSSQIVSSQRRPIARRGSASATDVVRSKTAPDVMAKVANGGAASVVVFLADQADVSAANDIKDQDARGWYVYRTLKAQADLTQPPIRKLLDGAGVRYQSFWAANMMVVDADQKLVDQLAARSDVSRIDSNDQVRWIEDPVIANKTDSSFQNFIDTTEWGVDNVNAPAV